MHIDKEMGSRLREFRDVLSKAGAIPDRPGAAVFNERDNFGASIGVGGGSVGNWESGTAGIKPANMMKMVEVYGLNSDWLRSGRGDMFMPSRGRRISAEEVAKKGSSGLPVYATEGIEGGAFVVRKPPLEWIDTPTPLIGRAGGYGLFISGGAMAPAFRYGDTVFCDPLLPPIEQTEVVVVRAEQHEGNEVKIIATLLGHDETNWTVSTSPSDPKQTLLLKDEWPKCHRVVGKFARR